MKYPADSNSTTKPIVITGDGEYALPETHCGGYEINWFDRWNGERSEYRCSNCLQRFRLRHTKGYRAPFSYYD